MSDLISFHGNSALKKQCIERIEKYRDSRWLNPVMMATWEPEHSMCTPMGALVESADLNDFESVTGIPSGLALFHQALVGVAAVSIPNQAFKETLHNAPPVFVLPDAIKEHWTAWLEAMEVGGKVPDLFARALTWIMRDLLSADHPVAPLPSSVRTQISTVVQLFESELDAQVVTGQQWTAARKRCVEMTDAAAVGDGQSAFVRPIAEFLESVCWSWSGDYEEPLQSLRSLAYGVTGVLAEQLLSPADREVIAGQRRAMDQYMVEAQKDPKFDPHAFFQQSEELKVYWGFEFQSVLANQKLQTTPLVGGRMLAGLVECIERYQSK